MYPSPLPEVKGSENPSDGMGQFSHSTSSPQPTLLAPSPPLVQIPQDVQQSFTSDAAIGLHYQMSSESQTYISGEMNTE